MSTIETFRPALHLTPGAGWMNDPNGLIVVDGIFHAFFQHDPHSTRHGPMHWGHATSVDLAHWTEQPVALFPDGLGTCYSGCAVETQCGEIKLFYTAHRRIDGADFQTQCLVHADRGLTVFASEPGNPIIDNRGLGVFRDPKVFWHEGTDRWIMVVTEGQSVGFHASTDLLTWTHLSSFGEGHGRHSDGPWECPDLVPLTAPDGTTAWVLIVGLNPGGYAPGSGTQYFIGQFDGTRFTNANSPENELWLDYGRDYYAAQTFFDRESRGAPIAMAWASNWLYAAGTPTHAFRGAMSLPRQLRLIETEVGPRVAASVPEQVRGRFEHLSLGEAPLQPSSGTYRISATIKLPPGERSQVALFGETTPQVRFTRSATGYAFLHLSRAAIGGMRDFAHDYEVPLGALAEFGIEIFVDNGLVEIAVDGGRVWATNLYFPAEIAGPITTRNAVRADEGAALI